MLNQLQVLMERWKKLKRRRKRFFLSEKKLQTLNLGISLSLRLLEDLLKLERLLKELTLALKRLVKMKLSKLPEKEEDPF